MMMAKASSGMLVALLAEGTLALAGTVSESENNGVDGMVMPPPMMHRDPAPPMEDMMGPVRCYKPMPLSPLLLPRPPGNMWLCERR